MRTGPNIRKRADGRFEARYEKARNAAGRIVYGYCYGKTYEEAAAKRAAILGQAEPSAPVTPVVRRMNLLILGAGSQGMVVKETAEALNVFHDVAFLDDDPANTLAIDSCENFRKYLDRFPIALPSFGNCELRGKWLRCLEEAGFIVPTLIHPMATVSPSAQVDAGTLVEAKAIVGAGAQIGVGCVIGSGAIVDLGAQVDAFSLIHCAATVKKNAHVPSGTWVDSGVIFE